MEITENTQVTFEYSLFDENGEPIGNGKQPQSVTYRHGKGEIIQGLESALAGKTVDEKFQVEIPPEYAYGERNEDLIETFPREHFAALEDPLEVGMYFEAQSEEGNVLFQVTDLTDTEVTVDANHPFAGKTLKFNIQINDVQAIREDETDT